MRGMPIAQWGVTVAGASVNTPALMNPRRGRARSTVQNRFALQPHGGDDAASEENGADFRPADRAGGAVLVAHDRSHQDMEREHPGDGDRRGEQRPRRGGEAEQLARRGEQEEDSGFQLDEDRAKRSERPLRRGRIVHRPRLAGGTASSAVMSRARQW
jgi:hypothetical protein